MKKCIAPPSYVFYGDRDMCKRLRWEGMRQYIIMENQNMQDLDQVERRRVVRDASGSILWTINCQYKHGLGKIIIFAPEQRLEAPEELPDNLLCVFSFLVEKRWWAYDGRMNVESSTNWGRACVHENVDPDDEEWAFRSISADCTADSLTWDDRFARVYVGVLKGGGVVDLSESVVSSRYFLTDPFQVLLWRTWMGFKSSNDDEDPDNCTFDALIADGYDFIGTKAQKIITLPDGHRISVAKASAGLAVWSDTGSKFAAYYSGLQSDMVCYDGYQRCYYTGHYTSVPTWFLEGFQGMYDMNTSSWAGPSQIDDSGSYSCGGTAGPSYGYVDSEGEFKTNTGNTVEYTNLVHMVTSPDASSYYRCIRCYVWQVGDTGEGGNLYNVSTYITFYGDMADWSAPGVANVLDYLTDGDSSEEYHYASISIFWSSTYDYLKTDFDPSVHYSFSLDGTSMVQRYTPMFGQSNPIYSCPWGNADNLQVLSDEKQVTTDEVDIRIAAYAGYGGFVNYGFFDVGTFGEPTITEEEGIYTITMDTGSGPWTEDVNNYNLAPTWGLPLAATIKVENGEVTSVTFGYAYDYTEEAEYMGTIDAGGVGTMDVTVVPATLEDEANEISCRIETYGANYNNYTYPEEFASDDCTARIYDLYSFAATHQEADQPVDVEVVKDIIQARVPGGIPFPPTMLLPRN